MASFSQESVYLMLAQAYLDAVKRGNETITLHVGRAVEILSLLDVRNKGKIEVVIPFDDRSDREIAALFGEDPQENWEESGSIPNPAPEEGLC